MANREENLKKINDELEQLSDEQLEKVAGGTYYETADDSRFLNVLLAGTKYHQCDRYGATRIFFSGAAGVDVQDAWKSLGIYTQACDISGSEKNRYMMSDGTKITQDQAWAYAEKVVGRHLKRTDWDW